MNETIKNPYGTPYLATEAARQVAQAAQNQAFSRFPGVDPVTIPKNHFPQEESHEKFQDAVSGPYTVTPPTPVKPYTLKRLQSRDVFPMLRILSKINFKELKACFSSPEIAAAVAKLSETNGTEGAEGAEGAEGKKNTADEIFSVVGVGVVLDVAGVIINNVPYCENELYSFLSSLSGMKVEEIMDLDAVIFFEMIVDVIKKPEFKDFMKVVSGFLK